MDAGWAHEFVRTNHRAVLATRRANGAPQLSPITVGAHPDGRIRISTRETAVKTRNVRRDPHVSLCLLNDGFFGDWAQVDGTVEIVPLPEAMEMLVDYYRDISGEHPDWDDYRAAMVRDQRVMMLVTIDRVGPTVSG